MKSQHDKKLRSTITREMRRYVARRQKSIGKHEAVRGAIANVVKALGATVDAYQAREPIDRIRDLPATEQGPFLRYLAGQKRPRLPGLPEDQQDGYWRWDYNEWKRHHR